MRKCISFTNYKILFNSY